MIISIDGPAGSGKSTVAEMLSKELNFIHFNSGSLYRGITAYVIDKNIDYKTMTDEEIAQINLKTELIAGIQHVWVNNKDYTSRLRDNDISILCAPVSINPSIRRVVDNCQREFAGNNNVVIEGRDIGSFVFPNAEFKFYLDCNIKERARRRFLEEQAKGNSITLQEIEQQIAERDKTDKAKKVAPLCVPKNAIIIDSSNLSPEQVVNKMKALIKN